MSSKNVIGNVVNVPVRKPTMEEVERNRERVEKLMERMKADPKLMQRYAELTATKFQELLGYIQAIGLDTNGTFLQVWEENSDEKCPFNPDQIGHAAMTTINIISVAMALSTMAREADHTTFTQEEIDSLFAGLPSDNERGN